METIISLHLPKTAGSSFSKALEKYFGNNLLLDYDDIPISKPNFERSREALLSSIRIAERGISGIKCVHGHFLPIKYLLLSVKNKLRFLTWMRNPVERVISHYFYWKGIYNSETSTSPHLKRVIDEDWSLERFCLGAEFRNLYSQYLWGFPLEMFDFVGIVEFYEDDLAYLSNYFLDAPLDAFYVNVCDSKNEVASELRKKIERHHDKDVQLYQRALQMRLSRRK
jgi:hypothetical protein